MAADALIMDVPARAGQAFDILLLPMSRPDLGEIRIGEGLFAVGRMEAPFSGYPEDVQAVLSRRHARLFVEDGVLYVADLGSKNGTRVNGEAIEQQPAALHDGDEITFGETLSYRVMLLPRPSAPEPPRVALSLSPVHDDLGLQPVVVTGFPFLISKADDVFARYLGAYPHQVNYLSRRHAHVFLRAGQPCLEDLGSTNGTFVNGQRLGDRAVVLKDGDMIAFGGNHFVYRVGIAREADGDATATRSIFLAPPMEEAIVAVATGAAPSVHADDSRPDSDPDPDPDPDPDKTTFVGAADSFLDIFCVDYAVARREDEINPDAPADADNTQPGARKPPPHERGRLALMLTEAARNFGMGDRRQMGRAGLWAGLVLVLAALGGGALYWRGMPEREIRTLLSDGDYARAATRANTYLGTHPEQPAVQQMGTEALMQAYVAIWAGRLRARDFSGAQASLAAMRADSTHNADARALVEEMAWVTRLEQFVAERGGPEAPVRMYADEDKIRALVKPWERDPAMHQRALDRIANYVPAFRDTYAEALSFLRKLQNDDSVYLAAIDRLHTAIATELGRDQPEALQPMLADYRQRYPRLLGLDRVEADLKQYTGIMQALRAREPGPLLARLGKASFATPPFQAQVRELAATRLPAGDVTRQYALADKAWQEGDSAGAIGALRAIGAGPWADDVAKDITHREQVAQRFAALRKSRGTREHDDQLLAFQAMLDPRADAWYAKAVSTEVVAIRDAALKRARDLMTRALATWRQYRNNGVIGGEQRLEPAISAKFRAQAKLLSEAQADARQGLGVYAQLGAADVASGAQWDKVRDDIQAEVDLQRRSLTELRQVLDPAVLQAKLALLGAGSPETAGPQAATTATTGTTAPAAPAVGVGRGVKQ
jgi:pSer/pThr/pTyr-binding forkhead associated (FHA) protein